LISQVISNNMGFPFSALEVSPQAGRNLPCAATSVLTATRCRD